MCGHESPVTDASKPKKQIYQKWSAAEHVVWTYGITAEKVLFNPYPANVENMVSS
jgi:hypothetical protein